MNNSVIKVVILAIYIYLLSKIMGFKIWLIINIPFFIMVLIGALVLAFLGYQKGTGQKGFYHKLKFTVLISGSLTAFLANVAFLSRNINDTAEIYQSAVYNFLPLFYSFFFYFIMDIIKIPMSGDTEINTIDSDGSDIERLEDYDLTRREIAVSHEILMKLSNSEIAEKLYISENTVKKHINHVFQKVGVRNRTEFILKFNSNKKDKEREDTYNDQ